MSTNNAAELQPLEGEAGIPPVTQHKSSNVSVKAIVALALVVASLVVGATMLVRRLTAPDPAKAEAKELAAAPRPVIATTSKRPKVEAPADPAPQAASAPNVQAHVVPAIEPDDEAKPIPMRGAAGSSNSVGAQQRKLDPMDAPLMVVSDAKAVKATHHPGADAPRSDATQQDASPQPQEDGLDATRANLRQYREQLQAMLPSLQGMARQVQGGTAANPGAPGAPNDIAETAASIVGGGSRGTARVSASTLGNRSLTLPRGTTFTCGLKTQVITSASGPISCQVLRNVYSDDGRVLLVERGSHLDGEYRMQNVRPGMVAIPATWQRLRMPNGVTIELLDSPATGPLGAAGIDGVVDNRWLERLGAAMLVSLVDGAVKIAVADAQDAGSGAVVVSQAGSNGSRLAEEILKSTINLPPILFKNQGGMVGVYVQKDLDFASVYELRAASK